MTRAVFPVGRLRIALEAGVAALIASAYAFLAYRVYDTRFEIPLYEDGADGRGVAAWVKGIDQNGWWLHNPYLGAPFGQNQHDFPANGETLQVLAIKALGYVLPGYGEIMNAYYLAGFGVLAAVALLVLRHLRFSLAISLPIALAYALLPFHIFHQEEHLTRSTYVSAPLACLLMIWALSWRSWFLVAPERPPGTPWRANVRRGRVAFALLLAVAVGATETMTTIFTATLLGASAIVAAVRWREPARLLVGGTLVAVLAGTFLLLSFPSFNYWRHEGRNPVAGNRLITEGELYGLKLTRLVLPEPTHRWHVLGDLGKRGQQSTTILSEGGQAIGLLGTIGFFGGVIGLLGHGLRRRGRRDERPPDDREALADHAGLLIVLAVLCATIAGFSTLIAVAGFDQVRTWNRIVVLIGFLALIVTAIGLERLLGRLRLSGLRRTAALGAVCAALIAFALWDSPPPPARDYAAMAASWDSDEAFVDGIRERLPDGSAIFQWPTYPFPEAFPPGTIRDFDHLRGYVHDDGRLRWSYGAVRGRPRADWQAIAGGMSPWQALPGLLGLGFTGYWIDSFGYDAETMAELQRQLTRRLRVEPLVSRDGRFLFYDLRPYAARLGEPPDELRRDATELFGI